MVLRQSSAFFVFVLRAWSWIHTHNVEAFAAATDGSELVTAFFALAAGEAAVSRAFPDRWRRCVFHGVVVVAAKWRLKVVTIRDAGDERHKLMRIGGVVGVFGGVFGCFWWWFGGDLGSVNHTSLIAAFHRRCYPYVRACMEVHHGRV